MVRERERERERKVNEKDRREKRKKLPHGLADYISFSYTLTGKMLSIPFKDIILFVGIVNPVIYAVILFM